jgi:hypothetical protein
MREVRVALAIPYSPIPTLGRSSLLFEEASPLAHTAIESVAPSFRTAAIVEKGGAFLERKSEIGPNSGKA